MENKEEEVTINREDFKHINDNCFRTMFKRSETGEVKIYSVRKIGAGIFPRYEIFNSEINQSVLNFAFKGMADDICSQMNNSYRAGWIDGSSGFAAMSGIEFDQFISKRGESK